MSDAAAPTDRLVSVVEHALRQSDMGTYLYFFDIHKLLYYLEKRLDDDNELKEWLSFYWYEDGPVAVMGQSVADRGQELGVFTEQPMSSGSRFHPIENASEIPEDDDVQEAKVAIERVLSGDYEITATHEEKLEQVYAEAPFEFQRQFKTRVLPMITEFNEVPSPSPEEVYNAVSAAEGYLPLDRSFDEVNDLYSQYLDLSRTFLLQREDKMPGHEIDEYIELSTSYWKLFCAKLRLETADEERDPEQYAHWEAEYEDRLETFNTEMVDFASEFVPEMTTEASPAARVSEQSAWGQVANELLHNSD